MRLLGNRILLKPDPELETKDGGEVVLPGLSREKPAWGEVVLLGSNCKEADITVGARVRVDTGFGSVEILHDGSPHRIHSVRDVQLVLE